MLNVSDTHMGPRCPLGRRRTVVVIAGAAWPWRRRWQSFDEREVPAETGDASLKSGVRAVRVAGVPVANIHSGEVGVHHPARAVAAAAGTCAVLLVVVRLVRELAAAASEDMKSTMAKDLASSAKVKGTAPETLSERVVVCAGRVEAAGGKIPKTVGNWKPGAGKCWKRSSGSTAGRGTPRKTTRDRGRRERHWKSRQQRYSSRPGAGAGEAGAAGSAAGAHAAVGGGDETGP